MTVDLRPIETPYRGYRFRSRLEARWAVFFDVMQIPWEYEAQGFETECGAYLPDFLLWGQLYAEVKPESGVSDHDVRRMKAFAMGRDLLLLHGAPDVKWYPLLQPPFAKEMNQDEPWVEWVDLSLSAHKRRAWVDGEGRDERPPRYELYCPDSLFLCACEKARAERFERGDRS